MTDDLSKRRLADPFNEGVQAAKARKMRSLAIAVGLILFVALIFAVSILKLSANTHAMTAPTGAPAAAAAPPAAPATPPAPAPHAG